MTEATAPAAAPAAGKNPAGIVRRPPFNHADPRAITRRAGFNPRFDFGEIGQLAKSIRANGVLMPLRVKRLAEEEGGKLFELVDGDRRLTAIEQIIAEGGDFPGGVPVIIVDKSQDDVTSLVQMFETNTGKAFLPLEKAAAFKRMRDAGLTLGDIEKRTGCSDNDIVGSLALLEADDEVVAAVRAGKISGGVAKSIAVNARGDRAKQAELAKEAAAAGKDRGAKRAVLKKIDDARRAKAEKKGLKLKMRALSDADLAEMGAALGETLKARLEAQGIGFDADLREWVSRDPELALAFTFGALEALKAAAGVKVDLHLGGV
jgi:ParB family chromosome partitioning protein